MEETRWRRRRRRRRSGEKHRRSRSRWLAGWQCVSVSLEIDRACTSPSTRR
jgi:hypothetical protein